MFPLNFGDYELLLGSEKLDTAIGRNFSLSLHTR